MQSRIKMNSKSLKIVFENIYQNYFLGYDLVSSGCFSLHWAQEGAMHESKGIIIKTKLPLKCYVCVKQNPTSNEVLFDDCTMYNLSKKCFEIIPYEQINKEYEHTRKMIREFLVENNYHYGVQIGYLSEIPRGHSLGFSDTSFAVLATNLFLLTNQLKKEDLFDYDVFLKSDAYKKILQFAWKLSFVPRYGNTIAQGIYSTLAKGNDIFVTYCEDFSELIGGGANIIDNVSYDHYSLFDRIKDSIITTELPFEYGLIYSGAPSDSKLVEQFKQADTRELEKYKSFIRNTLISDELINKKIYCTKFLNTTPLITYASDLITLLNIRSIYLMNQLLERGYNKDIVSQFIDNINSQRSVLSIITGPNSFSNDLTFHFKKHQSHPNEDIGITPLYSGKLGGGCFFVIQPNISRESIENAINDMKHTYPNIELEYCSYLDGHCEDGVIIEQYISQGLYGNYIQKDSVVYKDTKGVTYIGEYNSIIEKERNGLILDKISGKIYINGQKLTSKDVPSQSATIEIISVILDSKLKRISNSQLPISSYSKNKNEMVGKVIAPLLNSIRGLTEEKLIISCHGGLGDYHLQIDDSEVKIGVISKIK